MKKYLWSFVLYLAPMAARAFSLDLVQVDRTPKKFDRVAVQANYEHAIPGGREPRRARFVLEIPKTKSPEVWVFNHKNQIRAAVQKALASSGDPGDIARQCQEALKNLK